MGLTRILSCFPGRGCGSSLNGRSLYYYYWDTTGRPADRYVTCQSSSGLTDVLWRMRSLEPVQVDGSVLGVAGLGKIPEELQLVDALAHRHLEVTRLPDFGRFDAELKTMAKRLKILQELLDGLPVLVLVLIERSPPRITNAWDLLCGDLLIGKGI